MAGRTLAADAVINNAGSTIFNFGSIATNSMVNDGTILGVYTMAGDAERRRHHRAYLAVNGGTFAPGNGTPGSADDRHG